MSTPEIILSSTSVYRAALLTQIGIKFTTHAVNIDENPIVGETPVATCRRLSLGKAEAAMRYFSLDSLIIGSDQVLDIDGEAVSKPETHDRALAQLQRCQGRTLTSYTALTLIDVKRAITWSDVVATTIEYRDLPKCELVAYLQSERPYDCAGAVKIESAGIRLLKRVTSDDPSAIIGLPLIRLVDFLRAAEYKFS